MMTLDSPLTDINGVGPAVGKKFAGLGLKTVSDLIDYYPRRYEDYSKISKIKSLQPGPVSLRAVISHAKGRYVRRGLHITEAIASDDTDSVRLIWFNQPYRAAAINAHKTYFISGNFELSKGHLSIQNPSLELETDLPANTARILSVYKETKGLDSRQIRLAVAQLRPLIKSLPETLPLTILKDFNLVSYSSAMMGLHLPDSPTDLVKARRRLSLEEVFVLSLASLLNKRDIQSEKAVKVQFKQKLAQDFVKHLPFVLTDAQRATIWQIYKDMGKLQPMNRLVEGDVGSGKTVVAAMAALMVLAGGQQAALMAPTELLARQHADTIEKLLKPLGLNSQVVLLVGSMTTAEKNRARSAIMKGQAGFIIGTQALIQDKIDMHKLLLVIIDEQHRFGVEQRKALMSKAGHMPHVLSLTATPIPRSLALTLYGELDISLLRQKPPGRRPVLTEINWPEARPRLYLQIDEEIEAGRQVYVVCPSISQSALIDVQDVETVYENLSQGPFRRRRVGLLHGKLKPKDKQAVMEKFVKKKLDILVSTTVIEVGVDVPNATIMLIQSPERFGLAQLHQLRGRVGRGEHQGHCYLLSDSNDSPTKRLRALVSSNDGFKLAELDLDIRGPGALYGTSQHGLLDLRIAKLHDTHLIAEAVKAARDFIDSGESLLKYKQLSRRVNELRKVTNFN